MEEYNKVLKSKQLKKLFFCSKNKNIYELLREYKNFFDMYSYIVRPEKNGKNIILDKIYYHDYVSISLSAIWWKQNNYLNYEKISVKENISIKKISKVNYKQLKYNLLLKIYRYIIKNKIMMI